MERKEGIYGFWRRGLLLFVVLWFKHCWGSVLLLLLVAGTLPSLCFVSSTKIVDDTTAIVSLIN